MKLESTTAPIAQSNQIIFQKMENVANFEFLMPDNLEKFSVIDENSFVFALKGMPEIYLEKKQSLPYKQLIYGAKEGKIPFELTLLFTEIESQQTQVQFIFEGNFNPMLALMVKAPIGKLIQTMAERITKI